VLLAGAAAPEPPPLADLVEPDLWDALPADVPDLAALLPRADVYLQDEVQIAFHPTLTRVWCRKGRHGQHLVEAPGQHLVEAPGDNRKRYGFGLVDWRDGWFDGRVGPRRSAAPTCSATSCARPGSGRASVVAWPSSSPTTCAPIPHAARLAPGARVAR
jgi:hypothetical protein